MNSLLLQLLNRYSFYVHFLTCILKYFSDYLITGYYFKSRNFRDFRPFLRKFKLLKILTVFLAKIDFVITFDTVMLLTWNFKNSFIFIRTLKKFKYFYWSRHIFEMGRQKRNKYFLEIWRPVEAQDLIFIKIWWNLLEIVLNFLSKYRTELKNLISFLRHCLKVWP